MRATPQQIAEMQAQVEAALAAGKVTVCEADVDGSKAKESRNTFFRSQRDFEKGYTESRMRDAENRGIGDIQSERMMLHGEL